MQIPVWQVRAAQTVRRFRWAKRFSAHVDRTSDCFSCVNGGALDLQICIWYMLSACVRVCVCARALSKGSGLTWSRNRICLSAGPLDQRPVCQRSALKSGREQQWAGRTPLYFVHVCVFHFIVSHSSARPLQWSCHWLPCLNPAWLSVPALLAGTVGRSCQRKLWNIKHLQLLHKYWRCSYLCISSP